MIISKKRFKEEIENAVRIAIEKKDEEIRMSSFETKMNNKIDSVGDELFKEIRRISDRIDTIEESVLDKINDILCKISHKKKQLKV